MTYGIDVDRHRVELDLAKLTGDEFVIIKLGGTNVLPMYTSVAAAEQCRKARAAGKKVGWYWVTGGKISAADQAAYAIGAVLAAGYRDGDGFFLDDEVLDSNGQIWDDPKAAAFLVSVRAGLGCSYQNLGLYGSSGALFRPRSWPQIKALGVLIWVAAYGTNDGRRVTPDMGRTGLTPTLQQFTSSYRQQGYLLDRNWTAAPVGSIFRSYKPVVKPAAATVVPKTSTAVTGGPGKPGSYCWKRLQLLARKPKRHRYVGPVDGELGVFSWQGVQQALTDAGFYRGDVDGEPLVLTLVALQEWAGSKDPTHTADPYKIGRPNWRLIGKKLNSL